MNDKFKFRCYNKFQEKMFEVKSMSYIDDIVKRIEVQDEERILIFDEWQNNIDNTILMQCTGLKDKNGKLIYEGDIVKSFHVSSTMQGRVFIGFVTYDDERCRYCILENKHCGYVTFSNTDDVFEVIGNIYENKELLNENS